MSSRNIPGEFYDCTVQSYNDNGHGTHKIDYALQYGISIPMLKYVEELRMIFENTADDKSEKRAQRMEFLEFLMEEDVFLNYFQYFTTYINGGSNFPDLGEFGTNFETNKIIQITAGGNIITIFAKLIQDIMVNGRNVEIGFNRFMLEKWSLTKLMIRLMKGASKRLTQLVNNIASYNYSDFDYNLLPNKQYIIRSYENSNESNNEGKNNLYTYNRNQWFNNGRYNYRTRKNSDEKAGDMSNNEESFLTPDPSSKRYKAGFYLFRAKTNFEIRTPEVPSYFKVSHGRNYCKRAGIHPSKIELFYPQGAQEDWLSNRALHAHNNEYGNKKKCYKTIQNLLSIKQYIEQETRNNVSACINLMTETMDLYSEVDGAIEYIRSVNMAMNNLLKTLEYEITGEQYGEETDEERKAFLNVFSSLDSILSSDLPFISYEIINHLINSEELSDFTEKVMDLRVDQDGLPAPEGCTYNIIPTGLHTLLRKLKRPMDSLIYNEEKPPIDGFRISFNNIIIEPRKYEGEPVPKIYAEEGEFDELAKSFDQLAIQMKNVQVKNATRTAKSRLLRESGVGRLSKKKKRRNTNRKQRTKKLVHSRVK